MKLAQSISENALAIGKKQKILIQVNNANEEQKFGFSREDVFESFIHIRSLEGIKIEGLMNMAPLGIEENEIRKLFSDIVKLRNELEEKFNCEFKRDINGNEPGLQNSRSSRFDNVKGR